MYSCYIMRSPTLRSPRTLTSGALHRGMPFFIYVCDSTKKFLRVMPTRRRDLRSSPFVVQHLRPPYRFFSSIEKNPLIYTSSSLVPRGFLFFIFVSVITMCWFPVFFVLCFLFVNIVCGTRMALLLGMQNGVDPRRLSSASPKFPLFPDTIICLFVYLFISFQPLFSVPMRFRCIPRPNWLFDWR